MDKPWYPVSYLQIVDSQHYIAPGRYERMEHGVHGYMLMLLTLLVVHAVVEGGRGKGDDEGEST